MNAKIIDILEKHEVKPTAMRMLVLEQLIFQKRNLSLADLEELLYPADRITIYRTLQTFTKKGIVHAVETTHNSSVYGLCGKDCDSHAHTDQHPHFICERCKKITCNTDITYTINQQNNSSNYQINKVEITIKGICPGCLSS